jgi:hypothetical protein
MDIYARQGDLVIEKLAQAPDPSVMIEERNVVFAGDSSGHRHRLMGRALVQRDGRTTRVTIEAPTDLVHEKPDGHKTVPMAAGSYEIRPLREQGDAGERAVED